jgi:hypothetical protein
VSALDLSRWQFGITTLLITHDLDGLDQVDEIIVLDRGKITEPGTHDQLVAAGGRYRQMWQAHLAGHGAVPVTLATHLGRDHVGPCRLAPAAPGAAGSARVRNPRRNVGLASVAGTAACAILYVLVTAAVMGLGRQAGRRARGGLRDRRAERLDPGHRRGVPGARERRPVPAAVRLDSAAAGAARGA